MPDKRKPRPEAEALFDTWLASLGEVGMSQYWKPDELANFRMTVINEVIGGMSATWSAPEQEEWVALVLLRHEMFEKPFKSPKGAIRDLWTLLYSDTEKSTGLVFQLREEYDFGIATKTQEENLKAYDYMVAEAQRILHRMPVVGFDEDKQVFTGADAGAFTKAWAAIGNIQSGLYDGAATLLAESDDLTRSIFEAAYAQTKGIGDFQRNAFAEARTRTAKVEQELQTTTNIEAKASEVRLRLFRALYSTEPSEEEKLMLRMNISGDKLAFAGVRVLGVYNFLSTGLTEPEFVVAARFAEIGANPRESLDLREFALSPGLAKLYGAEQLKAWNDSLASEDAFEAWLDAGGFGEPPELLPFRSPPDLGTWLNGKLLEVQELGGKLEAADAERKRIERDKRVAQIALEAAEAEKRRAIEAGEDVEDIQREIDALREEEQHREEEEERKRKEKIAQEAERERLYREAITLTPAEVAMLPPELALRAALGLVRKDPEGNIVTDVGMEGLLARSSAESEVDYEARLRALFAHLLKYPAIQGMPNLTPDEAIQAAFAGGLFEPSPSELTKLFTPLVQRFLGGKYIAPGAREQFGIEALSAAPKLAAIFAQLMRFPKTTSVGTQQMALQQAESNLADWLSRLDISKFPGLFPSAVREVGGTVVSKTGAVPRRSITIFNQMPSPFRGG